MNNLEKISVIIPTYNREQYIEKAIQSVMNQTYAVDEIIIVDDGSIDNTCDVVNRIKDSRINYIKLEKNMGAGAARNIGVQNAMGTIIAFHDSDDEWNANKIEQQIDYMKLHPKCEIVYSAYSFVLQDGNKNIFPNAQDVPRSVLEGDIFPYILVRNTIGAPTVLMRKELFRRVGGFDESFNSLEDWDLAIRIAKENWIGFIGESLVDVHITGSGLSTDNTKYYINHCRIIQKYFDDYIEQNVLDETLMKIFNSASKRGILEQVKQLVMLHVQECMKKKE